MPDPTYYNRKKKEIKKGEGVLAYCQRYIFGVPTESKNNGNHAGKYKRCSKVSTRSNRLKK